MKKIIKYVGSPALNIGERFLNLIIDSYNSIAGKNKAQIKFNPAGIEAVVKDYESLFGGSVPDIRISDETVYNNAIDSCDSVPLYSALED